ncbi:hypothetical protein [Sphingobium sp. KCTC 72723]|uniref:hypothetical protein n=1 Tax=Sphingobium sp. KCTC 72723 TaxID=2733867 RepID=UPI00165D60C1|nr:hypothetical protein [Sphingobium sp. KCTC 72723]
MIATLVQIDAWAGARATPLRFASHDDERLCHVDGEVWWPAIAQLPTLRRDLFDGSFDAGSISSPSGDLTLSIDALPALPALALHDTRVRIWRGTLGMGFDAFALVFDGRVKEQPAIKDGLARLSIAVDDSWLDQPLLATYAGTGGAEGPAAMQGQVKPLALGAPRFAPATLIDAIDNIYQISAYGPMQAVETAFERLNRFGAATGDASNFASLKAADIAAGRWATCLGGGYVRLGAPSEGLLSFHVRGDAQGGWSRLPGDIIARIATIAGGAGRFAAGDVAALNIARPWPLSIMITDQTTARDLIQRIAASVNAVAYVDWLGVLRVAPVGIGAASLTMAADGSALPPVASIGQIAIAAPYWKIAQGAATTWQVHALSDIAFTAPLNPRGPYDNAESYREGDIVTLANGSQWLFVGVTPLTGSAPDDANINWFRLSGDITAGNITYEDGTPVEALKPAEPGATVGGTIGVDIRIPEIPGIPAPPGLLRNDMLALRTDGGLVYRPFGDLALEVELGKIALADIGAASDAQRRRLDNAIDSLSAAVTQALSEASKTRETFRDAGIYVDPATGIVKISAIDQTAERVSEAEIRLDAVRGEITQKASVSYVDGKIAEAVLDPSQYPAYEGLELRIHGAEQRISGAEASITQRASALTVDEQGARLTEAEIDIDALEGQIVLKVDSSDFSALGERVSSSEQVLQAIGDTASLTQVVSVSRRLPTDIGDTNERILRTLLVGDAARRGQLDAIAQGRNELTAKINDDLSAETRARQQLVVKVGTVEASALTETQARVDGDRAVSKQVFDLSAAIGGDLANFNQSIITLVDSDALISAGLSQTISAVRGVGENAADAAESALRSLLSGDKTGRDLASAIAAAREEVTVKVNADVDAVAQRVSAVLVRMGAAEASILSIELLRATADLAIVSRINQMTASIGRNTADIRDEEIARADAVSAQSGRIDTIVSRIGEEDAPGSIEAKIEEAATTYFADLQAQAGRIDTISARIGAPGAADSIEARIEAAATVYADPLLAQAERIDSVNARLGVPGAAGSIEAQIASASTAYVTPLGAQAERTDNVIARIGEEGDPDSIEAKVEDTREVLADVEGKLTARVRIAATAGNTVFLELVADGHEGSIIKLGGSVLALGVVTAENFVANALIVPAYVYMNGPLAGPGWDSGDTGPGGVGGGTGGGGGPGGGEIP